MNKRDSTIARNKARTLNLVGHKYNKLIVIERCLINNKGKIVSTPHWKCQCECLEYTIASTNNLRSGNVKSCGCINRANLIGKVFGELTVISFNSIRKQKSYWNCICSCGNTTIVSNNRLKSGNTKSCGHLLTNYRNNQQLEKHPGWRNDILWSERERLVNYGQRNRLPENTVWTNLVKQRDNWICQITQKRGGILTAHHLDGFHWCKEKRYDLNNGITLSKEIHDLFHHLYGNRKNTKEQFLEFKNRYDSGEWLDYQI